MHVENELVEIVTTDDHEFEEIVEEYEEEILVQEEIPEPPLTDSADTTLAQVKPRCITPYFWVIIVYICYVHLCYRNFMKTTQYSKKNFGTWPIPLGPTNGYVV